MQTQLQLEKQCQRQTRPCCVKSTSGQIKSDFCKCVVTKHTLLILKPVGHCSGSAVIQFGEKKSEVNWRGWIQIWSCLFSISEPHGVAPLAFAVTSPFPDRRALPNRPHVGHLCLPRILLLVPTAAVGEFTTAVFLHRQSHSHVKDSGAAVPLCRQ